jgi:cytochrome o ubiquinol oxidase subunit 2
MRQSARVPPRAYGSIDPHLFHAIAMQTIGPAPGPEPENPAHAGREATAEGRR